MQRTSIILFIRDWVSGEETVKKGSRVQMSEDTAMPLIRSGYAVLIGNITKAREKAVMNSLETRGNE